MAKAKKFATELEWLRWFHDNTDFGPADDDVQQNMREYFEEETGLKVPREYNNEEE